MKSLIIIDGYNVVKRIDELRRQVTKSLEAARNMLLIKLASHKKVSGADISVVFDGVKMSLQVQAGIAVHFSNLPNKADELIKRLVDQQPRSRTVTVVSSDNEVYHYAKSSGFRVERSEDFFSKLKSAKADSGDDHKNDPHISSREVDDWIKLFSND